MTSWFNPAEMNHSGKVYMPRGYETVGACGVENARRFTTPENAKAQGYEVHDRGDRTRTPRYVARRKG